MNVYRLASKLLSPLLIPQALKRDWGEICLVILGISGIVLSTPNNGFAQQAAHRTISRQILVDEIRTATQNQLAQYRHLVSTKKYQQAVPLIRTLLETPNQRLVQLPLTLPKKTSLQKQKKSPLDQFRHYVPLANYLQRELTCLAGPQKQHPLLTHYRDQVEILAKTWTEQGIANRDEALLKKVVRQFFLSRHTDHALLTLGEIALTQGDFETARDFWERISPSLRSPDQQSLWHWIQRTYPTLPIAKLPWQTITQKLASNRPTYHWLVYPDSKLSLAKIRAYLALVSLYQHDFQRARFEIALLEKLHPQAKGKIGGKQVVFTTYLKQNYRQLFSQQKKTSSPSPKKKNWTSFAGGQSREPFKQQVSIDLAGAPFKHIRLRETPYQVDRKTETLLRYPARHLAERANHLLPYFPVIARGTVYLGDANQVLAFSLTSGEKLWEVTSQIDDPLYVPEISTLKYRIGTPRFTLTYHRHLLIARMGWPVTGTPAARSEPPRYQGYLAVYDTRREGTLVAGPIKPPGRDWAFEGTPVTCGDFLYVALRRSGVQAEAFIACYDLRFPKATMRWKQKLLAAEVPAYDQIQTISHHLLTLTENRLYYNSHLGMVTALDLADGRILWATAYPKATELKSDLRPKTVYRQRNFSPALVSGGMVFAAPGDSRLLFALDQSTGRLLWKSSHQEGVLHLLGVRGDCLISSGDQLWWNNRFTGKLSSIAVPNPFPNSHQGRQSGFGRGVLTESHVYFPTRHKIFVFDAITGFIPHPKNINQQRQPIDLTRRQVTGGNLTLVDGKLLISSGTDLWFFSTGTSPLKQTSPQTTGQFSPGLP